MELTIVQALQHGVAAHKAGKLEEAERLYRAILKSQPAHPDANHNLGVIAVSVNKADAALPLFKTAVEANPLIEQFWLSYVDALIKEKQFDNAKEVFEQAKKQVVAGEKVNALEKDLRLITEARRTALPGQKKHNKAKKQNLKAISPSDTELKILLEHYQNGRYCDAVKLALSITEQFPKDQFAWKVLGSAHKQTGRVRESLAASQKAVALSPQDAEAHSNFGNTLQELGRLDEAEASLRQAITLKPDFVKAHYNLGNTLQELGRLDEAKASYTQAIALKPDYAEAHSNLAITLHELGRLEEAEASYKKAIALKPDYAKAHNNFGSTLIGLGKLEVAEASYKQAISLKPNYAEAILNLSDVQTYMNNLEAAVVSLQNILQIDSDNIGLRAGVNLAIFNFLEANFVDSKKNLLAAGKIQEKTDKKFKNDIVYWRYLLKILNWHEDKYFGAYNRRIDKILYVVGESHSLVSHYLHVQNSGSDVLCEAKLIKGCKQWHLGRSFRNQYKNQFESIFCSLPTSSQVLLAIGEIDCRLDSGIIKHKNKFPEKEVEEIIATTIENFLTYIVKNNSDCQHNIIIQGIPCPNIGTEAYSEKEVMQLIEVIKKFNCELKNKSKEKGFEFLDVYKLTDRGDGFSNAIWHIDSIHLSPDGMIEAWRRHVPKQKCV